MPGKVLEGCARMCPSARPPALSVWAVEAMSWLLQLSHALDTLCPCPVGPGRLPERPMCGTASAAMEGGSQGTKIRACPTPVCCTRRGAGAWPGLGADCVVKGQCKRGPCWPHLGGRPHSLRAAGTLSQWGPGYLEASAATSVIGCWG